MEKAIHPSYVEGQIQGGAVQGIGWAMNEEYSYDDKGLMRNTGFLDYHMPTCYHLPMIDTIMVEAPNPGHPLGIRGVGEVPIAPPPAAIANAIGLLFEMGRKNVSPPFDRLRANGFDSESMKDFPFVLSLSKHERRLSGTSHLGKLYKLCKFRR